VSLPASGSDSRIDLEAVPYAVRRWRIVETSPAQVIDNTEGKPGDPGGTAAPGKGSRLPGNRTVRVELEEATFDADADENIFAGPIAVIAKNYLWVKIYPYGREFDYHLIHFQVETIDHTGEAGGLQPITLSGTSDGDYWLYGEDKPF
jgi:hypothetical protein